jgi:ElaB/YqjD/DUF883 family membrane-anchored ribosome-binding protein
MEEQKYAANPENPVNPANQGTTWDFSEVKAFLEVTLDQGSKLLKDLSQKPFESGDVLFKKAEDYSKKAVDKSTDAIKQHPLITLLVAFGLGFLVVKLLKRK